MQAECQQHSAAGDRPAETELVQTEPAMSRGGAFRRVEGETPRCREAEPFVGPRVKPREVQRRSLWRVEGRAPPSVMSWAT